MSIIQTIRERGGLISAIIIAIALLGFILTDYFQAKDRLGSSGSTTLGSVNGKKIDWASFEKRLKVIDKDAQARARQQGMELSEAQRQSNNEMLWNNQVEKITMEPEFKKLGIEVGKKEFNEYLFGQNPPQEMIMNFGDQQGGYDGAVAQSRVNQIKRSGTPEEVERLDAFLADLEYQLKLKKFNSLLNNSIYYPKWYVEKQNAESAGLAKISYVNYPYSKIADSTIKITDKEIEDYVSKHKEQFRQEESRSISYVIFDAAPSAEDSAKIRNDLELLKPAFAATKEPARFISSNTSAIPYYDGFVGKSQIQVPAKDSIFTLAKDSVYGPYLDQNTYVLAKLIETKSLPDSVKARHILIQTFDPQSGQQLLDDSTAKKRIDSIHTAIKGGARFDSLAVKYSNDQGSAVKGGLLSNSQNPATNYYTIGSMVKEFNDFSFEKKTGDRDVVKTVFGYHLIEILDQKNFQPHYKVAYFSKNIIASEDTDRGVLDEASKFSNESKDQKTFDANIAKSNGRLEKLEATGIGPNDISIRSIDQRLAGGFNQVVPCRKLVRDIYEADKGDVLKQERIGDIKMGYKYIVAIVTDVLEKGLQPARIARQRVEPVLRNEKKVEQVKTMIASAKTLEEVAGILKDSIITVDSLRMQIQNSYGFSPKAIGAIFNNANKGKLINQPFVGLNGVIVIRVDDLTSTSVLTGDVESQRNQMILMRKGMQSQSSNPIQLMRKIANIKDNRRDFY